jgi:hypothetical protein
VNAEKATQNLIQSRMKRATARTQKQKQKQKQKQEQLTRKNIQTRMTK